MTETISKEKLIKDGRLPNGRFAPGSKPNPKGNNQFTSLVPLLEALKKSNVKYGQDFWDYVSERIRKNDTVLIAVLKKLLPDKVQGEGFGEGMRIIIVRDRQPQEANVRLTNSAQAISG